MPFDATVALAVVPSGKVTVTVTVEPGSPVPATVNVPLAFAVVVAVGASGAVVSVKADVVAGDALPAGSVATTATGPEVCGVADVAV